MFTIRLWSAMVNHGQLLQGHGHLGPDCGQPLQNHGNQDHGQPWQDQNGTVVPKTLVLGSLVHGCP